MLWKTKNLIPHNLIQYSMNNLKNNKPIWKHPWGYIESFLISIELLFLGFIIEILSGSKGVPLIKWPVNIIIGLIYISFIILIQKKYNKKPVIIWLSSIPAAISSICLFCFLSLLLGFIPQNNSNLNIISLFGLNHLQRSWPFLLSGIYLLTVLGFIALKRLKPVNKKNIGFFINHAGLWLTLFAIVLGSGDLLRLKLKLTEGNEPKNIVVDSKLNLYQLPFKIKLLDFNIEEYPPKLALIETDSKKIVKDITNNLTLIEKGLKTKIDYYEIEILKFFPNSIKKDSLFIDTNVIGARASAFIKVINTKNGKIKKGWIAPGFFAPYEFLELDSLHTITLTVPEPKVFSSLVEIYKKNYTVDTAKIEVNKPYSISGYKLYQTSYDEKMGKYSFTSYLEVVYDPWLYIIYTGLIMLIAGAVYMFWIGKDK